MKTLTKAAGRATLAFVFVVVGSAHLHAMPSTRPFLGGDLTKREALISLKKSAPKEKLTERKKKHGAQGTGNFKGKRDRHDKPGPMHEKKRWKSGWIPKR
jgi:hypothetical protein